MSRDDPALAALLAAVWEARLATLRRRTADAEATVGAIGALDAARRRQQAVIAAELDAPVAGRVHDLWGAWADRRHAELNQRLARQRAGEAAARLAALEAFGRSEALRLAEAEAAALRSALARRRLARTGRG